MTRQRNVIYHFVMHVTSHLYQLANRNYVVTLLIKCYLAAIWHMHIENNWEDPGICQMAKLELVLKGVKMVQAAKHKPEIHQSP